MTKASDNVFPRFLISEGGSTSTPAANRVTVYAKADGLLYSKDDAGAEKLLSSGPAAGISAGTTFPVSPSTNDLFHRTDLAGVYYYTGSAWHSITLYAAHMAPPPAAVSVSTANYAGAGMFNGGDVYLVDYHYQYNVATTNTGTQYWAWTLQKLEAGTGTTGTTIVAPNSSAVAAGWNGGTTAINAAHTDVGALRVNADKTSTPGNFTGWFCVTYRLIAT